MNEGSGGGANGEALRELLEWLRSECVWPANALKYADRWEAALESAIGSSASGTDAT